MPAAVEMRHITRRFGAVVANDDVTFAVERGAIHALVGENGAGKTTLMRILYGMERADAGQIFVGGSRVSIDTPADAIRLGIGMVHQHFLLVPPLTVAENVVLGKEPRTAGAFSARRRATQTVRELASHYRLSVDPELPVSGLPVGLQQRVEILKLLYRDAHILILDEPTAILTPGEVGEFFDTLRRLKDRGRTVILITHRLGEVEAISDSVTVLRRGRVVATALTRTTTRPELARMMVGQDIESAARSPSAAPGDPALVLAGVSALSDRKLPAVRDVSFTLHRGEILGIAAVEGNGQHELVDVVSGRRGIISGSIEFKSPPGRRKSHALAHIPEDRLRDGIIGEFTLAENLLLGRQRENEFGSRWMLNKRSVQDFAGRLVHEFDIRPPEPSRKGNGFSGGNQQKAVVARELSKDAPIIIANHPTRGLDIAATNAVHRALLGEKKRGKAVLLLSSDLSELLLLSDRIAVMFAGEFVALLNAGQTSEGDLGEYMTGARGRGVA